MTISIQAEDLALYHQLSAFEKVILRTCCYWPHRKRRIRDVAAVRDTARFLATYQQAFGDRLETLVHGQAVLDFGCGTGEYVLGLAQLGARFSLGLDIQSEFEFAQAEVAHRGLHGVGFTNGDSRQLAENSFDVTISHNSFEHFDDPAMILSEMARVTKSGGHVLIKFGPPWRNPWGRHMSGTFRKDRPYLHLILPEKTLMRVHSAYHGISPFRTRYSQLPGGLNKMTLRRFKQLLRKQKDISVLHATVTTIYGLPFLRRLPVIGELTSSSMSVVCVKQ